MKKTELVLSKLPKTWFIDLDGTIASHNGYKTEQGDVILSNSKDFLTKLPPEDMVIIVTSRTKNDSQITEKILNENGIRYNRIIYDLPLGERILINDEKPSGLKTAFSVNLQRNEGINIVLKIDDQL